MPDDRDVYFVGCAAGGSGDRVDAAAPIVATLIERGRPAALIFENLAERTLAFAQLAKRANPDKGYEMVNQTRARVRVGNLVSLG